MVRIFTFSGPRGVGKSRVIDGLSGEYNIKPIVPYTTREPRSGEIEGRDYNFVTPEEFKAIRDGVGMFDVLTVSGKSYGTPLKAFLEAATPEESEHGTLRAVNLAAGSALQLREELGASAVRSIFLLPCNFLHIEQQLRESGLGETSIRDRRAAEPTDLTMLPMFDRIFVNSYGEVGRTVEEVAKYISTVSVLPLVRKI